jgi:hypothetical protein
VSKESIAAASSEGEDLKAKLARLREERRKREEAEDHANEPERLALEIRNEEALAEAVRSIGPVGKAIGTVKTRLGIIIVKKPNHMLVRRFRDKGETDSKAWEDLIRPCLVHPSAEEFDRILEDQNVVLAAVGTMVLRLGGLDDLSGKS